MGRIVERIGVHSREIGIDNERRKTVALVWESRGEVVIRAVLNRVGTHVVDSRIG